MDVTIIAVILGTVLLFVLLALGSPFYIAFLASSIPILLWGAGQGGLSLGALASDNLRSLTMTMIPLYILLGNIMLVSGATKILFDAARVLVGGLRAGLGMAVVVANGMFGAVCGSAVAAAAAFSRIVLPELGRSGYNREVSAAICGGSAGLSLMIPPSLVFIVLGDVLGVSIGDLFVAGFVPGIILVGILCIAVHLLVRGKPEIKPEQHYSWGERGRTILRAVPVAIIPLAIIGTIYGGIATPTEAAGVSILVALLLAVFYFRRFGGKEAKTCLRNTVVSSAAIFCIMIGALIYGRALAFMQIPQTLAATVAGLDLGLNAFRLVFFGLFFFLGMFLDPFVIVFVCLPPLLPAIALYPAIAGDLVSFAIMFTFILILSGLTPPVCIILYSASSGAGADSGGTIKESRYFLAAVAMVTLLVLFVPAIGGVY